MIGTHSLEGILTSSKTLAFRSPLHGKMCRKPRTPQQNKFCVQAASETVTDERVPEGVIALLDLLLEIRGKDAATRPVLDQRRNICDNA